MQNIVLSIVGGWTLGVIFTACRIPLPVPPLMGLIAAGAVLAGQASWTLLWQLIPNRL
jgi:XapX domain-containing protein